MDTANNATIFNASQDLILIVDDDGISRRLLSMMVQNMGFRTLCVEDGYYLTFSIAYFSNVKAILMDMQMPKLDGYQTTRKIRSLFKQSKSIDHLPIIAVTVDDNRAKCIKAGCDLHILKPIDRDILADSLRSIGLVPISNYTK
jgi:CheY-like chemotaxis protein